MTGTLRTVGCTSMDEATDEEIALIMGQAGVVLQGQLLGNVLGLLEGLKGDQLGYQVDRYEHSLQTASRAYRDGARADLVVAGVLHDIGEGLAPANHSGSRRQSFSRTSTKRQASSCGITGCSRDTTTSTRWAGTAMLAISIGTRPTSTRPCTFAPSGTSAPSILVTRAFPSRRSCP